jgi:hypothetical protein
MIVSDKVVSIHSDRRIGSRSNSYDNYALTNMHTQWLSTEKSFFSTLVHDIPFTNVSHWRDIFLGFFIEYPASAGYADQIIYLQYLPRRKNEIQIVPVKGRRYFENKQQDIF